MTALEVSERDAADFPGGAKGTPAADAEVPAPRIEVTMSVTARLDLAVPVAVQILEEGAAGGEGARCGRQKDRRA